MPVVRGTLNRQDFPAGRQGESLVIDPNTPHGIAWRQRATQAYADGVVLERAYMCADKTFSGVSYTSLTAATENWGTVLTGWNLREVENWEESSGEFQYTGAFPTSGTRKFLLSYDYTIYANSSRSFVKMLGRITRDTGSGHAVVPGSSASTDWYSVLAFFGYHSIFQLSHSSIVSVESDDVISFQYGTMASAGAAYNVSNIATTEGSGVVITITPADIIT